MSRFFPTVVEKRRIRARFNRDEALLNTFLAGVDPTPRILDTYIQSELHKETDNFVTIQILGDPNSGKSGVGQFIAQCHAKIPFTAERVELHYNDFMQLLPSARPGMFTILDEQTKIHGAGSRRIQDDIVNVIETCRKNGASFILISPTEKMLDENDVHLTISILARDGPDCLCAWKSRTRDWLGICIITVNWNDQVWQDYQAKKDAYIEQARSLEFHKTDYDALTEKVLAHPLAAKAEKRAEWLLVIEQALPNLTIEEKRLLYAAIKMKEK